MFNHKWANIPKLKQINSPAGRKYEIEGTEVSYPSITTVLSAMQDKSALFEWRKRVGEERANAISLNATTRGTAMHQLCEDYLRNEPMSDTGSTSGDFLFRAIRPTLDRIDNVRCLETGLYSTRFKVAGTVDCVAELDGKLTIIDFKTASKPKQEKWIQNYFMQGCFYLSAYYEITKEMPEQIAILISVQDGSMQEFILDKAAIMHYTLKLKETVSRYYTEMEYSQLG